MSDPDTRSNEADNLHESLRKKLKYERGEYDGREVDFYLNPKIGSYVHGLETVRANPKNLAGVSFKLNEFKDNSGFYVEARVAEIIGRITLRSYKKTFFVQDLWVRRDFQRRGIGVELFRLAAEHARKRGAVIVSDQNMRSADADALHRYLCKVLPHRKEKHDDGEGRLNDCDVYSNPIAPACEQAARAAEKSAGRKYGEGQCQVCENTQAVGAGGAIVFHGYERPGYGFTLGRCMGADHMPFPATDALEDYVRNLRSMIEHSEGVLASLPTRTSVTVSTPPTVCGGAPGSKVVEKAAVTALEWQAAVRQVESAARTKIRFCREDIPRAEKRIAEGRRLSGE